MIMEYLTVVVIPQNDPQLLLNALEKSLITDPHDLGDVSKEHEIQLGNWHHGRVATNED